MGKGSLSMQLLTIYIPRPWVKDLDALVRAKMYANRSEAIRSAVRDLIKQEAPAL